MGWSSRKNGFRRGRRVIAAVVAIGLLAVVPIGLGDLDPASGVTGGRYVALGDSYTAGPLILPQSLSPLGCLRSGRNYPSLVRTQIGATSYADVSCSGAQTQHMTTSQGVTPGPNPPQFNALTTSTLVVTVGIGGNDIGFSGLVQNCATVNPFGRPCRNDYVVNGVDQISQRIASTAPRVAGVIQGIRQRSPNARIFVVGYPSILPDTGFGCWPQMPLTFTDVPWLRSKHKELNSMLRAQAQANGATYVDTYTPSIGRDACRSASTRWVEPIIPATDAAPVHPNARGMAGMAPVVSAAIRAAA